MRMARKNSSKRNTTDKSRERRYEETRAGISPLTAVHMPARERPYPGVRHIRGMFIAAHSRRISSGQMLA